MKKNCVHESNKMVRRTRFWKGKKWQFAVKQQQQNDDGDDVAVSTDDSHFVFCNRPALNAQFRYVHCVLFLLLSLLILLQFHLLEETSVLQSPSFLTQHKQNFLLFFLF